MAVTGETAKFKLPYFKPGDSPPDMAAVTKAISERVEAVLAKGGDVSIAADGTVTIGNGVVDAARIAGALKGGAAAGTEALRALGTTATTAAAGNDSRLSNERVPTANSVNSSKVEDGSLIDSDLASPNNAAYRTLFQAAQLLQTDLAAGTYWLQNYPGNIAPSGSEGGIGPSSPGFFHFDDADYAVAGKTQKLRLRAQILTNATKPTLKFTVGLYPITVAGGADTLKVTLGTVVPGSTVEFNEPAASTPSAGSSGDFTIPADGAYVLGVVTSATLTNNAVALMSGLLQTRSV